MLNFIDAEEARKRTLISKKNISTKRIQELKDKICKSIKAGRFETDIWSFDVEELPDEIWKELTDAGFKIEYLDYEHINKNASDIRINWK